MFKLLKIFLLNQASRSQNMDLNIQLVRYDANFDADTPKSIVMLRINSS